MEIIVLIPAVDATAPEKKALIHEYDSSAGICGFDGKIHKLSL